MKLFKEFINYIQNKTSKGLNDINDLNDKHVYKFDKIIIKSENFDKVIKELKDTTYDMLDDIDEINIEQKNEMIDWEIVDFPESNYCFNNTNKQNII